MLIDDPFRRGILIVDDERAICEVFEMMLRGAGFSDIVIAADGVDALLKIKEAGAKIYVVCSDLLMPRMDGIEFLSKLAANIDFPIGFIAISGYKFEGERAAKFQQSENGNVLPVKFLPKPVAHETLLTEVRRAAALVHERRLRVASGNLQTVFSEVRETKSAVLKLADCAAELRASLNNVKDTQQELAQQMREVSAMLAKATESKPTLVHELGMEILKAAILAAAVLGLLYLGVSDFLHRIIGH